MSARDVIAEAAWLLDREIAGAPLPAPAWATFKDNDPETAAIYETQAGCHLYDLSAAGLVVVPQEPTGGETRPHNIVPACRRCNSSKRAQDVWTWLSRTGRTPHERLHDRLDLEDIHGR